MPSCSPGSDQNFGNSRFVSPPRSLKNHHNSKYFNCAVGGGALQRLVDTKLTGSWKQKPVAPDMSDIVSSCPKHKPWTPPPQAILWYTGSLAVLSGVSGGDWGWGGVVSRVLDPSACLRSTAETVQLKSNMFWSRDFHLMRRGCSK